MPPTGITAGRCIKIREELFLRTGTSVDMAAVSELFPWISGALSVSTNWGVCAFVYLGMPDI